MCSMHFVAVSLHTCVIFLSSSCESNERMRLTHVSLDFPLIRFHRCFRQWEGHEQYTLRSAGKTYKQPLELRSGHCCFSAKGSGWQGLAFLMHWGTETNLEQMRQQESFKDQKKPESLTESEWILVIFMLQLTLQPFQNSQRLTLPTSLESLSIWY